MSFFTFSTQIFNSYLFVSYLIRMTIDIKVDPAMMAALMAACSVIQTGANTEEVILIMVMDGGDYHEIWMTE